MKVDMNEVVEKLKESYIKDLSKPNIDKFERAELLKKFMKRQGYSLGDMCKIFGFKKGTLSGWLKWDELGKEKYEQLKKTGMTESDITNMLKGENSTVEGQFLMLIKTMTHFMDRNTIKVDKDLKEEMTKLRNKLQTLIYRNGDRY